MYKLEANVDDMTGEMLGFLMEKLFESGARDVYYTPINMKKNRPAIKISVISKGENLEDIIYTIFKDSSSIGLRYYPVERRIMKREIVEIDSIYGPLSLKRASYKDIEKVSPEYEDCKELAHREGISILDVYKMVNKRDI